MNKERERALKEARKVEEEIGRQLRQLELSVCLQVAQQVTGIPVTMADGQRGGKYVQRLRELPAEERGRIVKAINAQPDPLVRLAIAEAFSAIDPTMNGCGCCERKLTEKFLALTDELGIRSLVQELPPDNFPRETYEIGRQSYSDAHQALALLGGEEFASQIQQKREELAEAAASVKALLEDDSRLSHEEALAEVLGGQEVSARLRLFIEELMKMERCSIGKVRVLDPDTAVFLVARSEWGGSGGIGYFDQVVIYHHGRDQMQEWQWRNRYSSSADRHDLCINDLGQIQIDERGGQVKITVELVNEEYGNRIAEFVFEPTEATPSPPKLNETEQAAFEGEVDAAIAQILAQKMASWRLKPKMYQDYGDQKYGVVIQMPMGTPGQVSYRTPSVRHRIISARLGLAVFVAEEQIDHRIADPQLRYELYVMVPGQEPRLIYENHAYESAGSAAIAVLRLEEDHVVLSTEGRQEAVALN
ncbi:MAG: hypothetical protein WC518_00955 [Patescibacteria group bacterium]